MRKKWTEKHDEKLREVWDGMSLDAAARLLGFSMSQISVRARLLGLPLKHGGRPGRWSPAHDAELTRLWPDHNAIEIARRMRFSRNQIILKAKVLRLPAKKIGISATDLETIRSMWPDHGPNEIAARLGLTPRVISGAAAKMGLAPKHRHFSFEEEEVIRQMWNKVPASIIAERLGRATTTIYLHSIQMGLPEPLGARKPRTDHSRLWTEEEDARVLDFRGPLQKLAEALGRTYAAMRQRRSILRRRTPRAALD